MSVARSKTVSKTVECYKTGVECIVRFVNLLTVSFIIILPDLDYILLDI